MGIFDFLSRSEKPKQKKYKDLYRNYAGADGGRLFGDFIASSFSADSELKTSLPVLRNRSRDLARNNEYAKRYLNLVKTNVVGEKGFSVQVRARNDDRSLDAAGNAIIENAFTLGAHGQCRCDRQTAGLIVNVSPPKHWHEMARCSSRRL